LDEILKRAKAPKGSFYHHFSSKNEFALVLIGEYNNYFRRRLTRVLMGEKNEDCRAVARIRALVDDLSKSMAKHEFRRGCLIGNFSQELGASYEDFRIRLEGVFREWEAMLAECIARGQSEGDIDPNIDPQQAAIFFWTGWEGAVMRAKLAVSAKPLLDFGDAFVSMIRARPASAETPGAPLTDRRGRGGYAPRDRGLRAWRAVRRGADPSG
jgi:TetR/AcrR family transcriptional repressor of nem operon